MCVACVYPCVYSYVHRWDTVPQYTELKVLLQVYEPKLLSVSVLSAATCVCGFSRRVSTRSRASRVG